VGTAVNCIPQLAQCNFSLVIVDEAHHSVADTYKTVLRGLGFVDWVVVAGNTSSSSSSDEAGGGAFEADESGVDASADSALRLAERRREWKKQYAESGVEPDDAVLGLQALPYADVAYYSSSSSSQTESTEDWDAAAAADPGSDGAIYLAMRALNNPDRLCVGFTATPYR
jgi:hypothetical protein